MKSEFNKLGSELHSTTEFHLPQDQDGIVSMEYAMPQGEFTECAPEFLDIQQEAEGESEETTANGSEKRKKRNEKAKAHQSLLAKMSYLVVSVVAVATLSQTLDYTRLIQNNVVSAGGSVEGDFRFSIQWNENGRNPNDFDAHCVEPGGYEIFFGNRGTVSPAGGTLDVDIVHPEEELAVENIVYEDKKDMEEGTYELYVHCYSHNGGKSGFSAEVEIGGRVHRFKYNKELEPGEIIVVAEVTLENGRFKLERMLGQ